MKHRFTVIILSRRGLLAAVSVLFACVTLLALLLLLDGTASTPALAQASTGIIRVATTGSDTPGCGSDAAPCRTPQYAVNQAQAGDEIRVATGVYTGVQTRSVYVQVLYVDKTVTVRGGYTTTNWGTSDPAAFPTTLDAEGQGRVVAIVGTIEPTIEGLRITGGDAMGLRGKPGVLQDAGGGVYVYQAAATISDCLIYGNTASSTEGNGGGLYLLNSESTLTGNTVQENTAGTGSWGYGGGLTLDESDATLVSNTVVSNTACTTCQGDGGGLYLYGSDATLIGNTVQDNTASQGDAGAGGGLFMSFGDVTLTGNTVRGNVASTAFQGQGGGLKLNNARITLEGNTIISNVASITGPGYGGALNSWYFCAITMTNNLVAANYASESGSGLEFWGLEVMPCSARLMHNTIVDNLGSGEGIYVTPYATLALTNTILAGHSSVGITATAGSATTLEGTLWYGNAQDTGGTGTTVTGTVNVYGDPAFVDPGAWDYHLGEGSAANGAGVDTGVVTDIDGQARPCGARYDIGADEYVISVFLPLVLRED